MVGVCSTVFRVSPKIYVFIQELMCARNRRYFNITRFNDIR